MFSRRNFIKSISWSSLSIPLFSGSSSAASAASNKVTAPLFPADNDPEYWKKVRKMFTMVEGQSHFNTGTLGGMPTMVSEAIVENVRSSAANIAAIGKEGGPKALSYGPETGLREKLAKIMNAEVGEVSYTQNSTMGMNFLSNGLDLNAGDEVVLTDQEHPGGKCGWDLISSRKGVVLKTVELDLPANDPGKIIDGFKKAITPKTKVFAFSHVSFITGTVLPVKEICKLAKEHGIITVIDGAQGLGNTKVDVKDLGCDVYFSSTHKWLLAPSGTGALYISKDISPKVWTTIASNTWDKHKDEGERFTERGTGSSILVTGVEAALDFHLKVGPDKVYSRIKFLGDYLRNGLLKIENVTLNTPTNPAMSAGLTAYGIAKLEPNAIIDEMWNKKKIYVRGVPHNAVRFSTHIFNSTEEIDNALEVTRELSKKA